MISVIIPTYNRVKYLSLALDSLVSQNFNFSKDNFEVIVVDDGSDEDYSQVIQAFESKLNLQFLRQGHGGVCKARNAGIAVANGEVLAFFDDDAVADSNWLMTIVEATTIEPLIVGRVKPLSKPFWNYFAPHYDRGEEMKPVYGSLLEGNCAIKREVFDRVGLFDEGIDYGHEGQEFLNRAQQFYILKYCPKMVIYHDYAFGLIDYLGKQHKFGEKSAYLESKNNNQSAIPQIKETNWALEQLPLVKKTIVKIVAKVGSLFHWWGFKMGKNKYK